MARRSGLGKGLASLIPPASAEPDGFEVALRDIALATIEPNPGQPRAQFDEESLGELTASIRELGVLQPILVREVATGRYQLIAGERRWRAARRAGLTTIPAIIRTTDDRGLVEQALVENLQREDLTALEEASAFQQLIEGFGLTHDEVATRVGKSRSAVTNTVRLLQLPPAIQRFVAEGQLTAGHAAGPSWARLIGPTRSSSPAKPSRSTGRCGRRRRRCVVARCPPRRRRAPRAVPRGRALVCRPCRRCAHRACWSSRCCWLSTSTRG